ncbi:MAG: hypothetical protein QG608_488 [Actinomycetota bacterium]|nr:hypothetical protein [Actinomycetota bacterium]
MRTFAFGRPGAVCVALVLLGAPPAHAAGPPVPGSAAPAAAPADRVLNPLECPGVVAAPGGYRLTGDTQCSLEWREDDTVLDLAGHTYTGGIMPFGKRQTVRNGSLVLGTQYWANSVGFTLSHLRITSVATAPGGFHIEMGSDSLVENCVLSGIPGIALSYYFGKRGTVRDSAFLDNGKGISVQAGGGILIQRNSFRGNNVGVNVWNERGFLKDVTVQGNVFRDNAFSGVLLNVSGQGPREHLQNTDVHANRFLDNGAAGMYVHLRCGYPDNLQCANTEGNRIRRNVFLGNGHDVPEGTSPGIDDGLTARMSDTNNTGSFPEELEEFQVTSNIALLNADLGLDVAGVLDGGRNRALGNGNPAQCDGVECGRPGAGASPTADHPAAGPATDAGEPAQLRH